MQILGMPVCSVVRGTLIISYRGGGGAGGTSAASTDGGQKYFHSSGGIWVRACVFQPPPGQVVSQARPTHEERGLGEVPTVELF